MSETVVGEPRTWNRRSYPPGELPISGVTPHRVLMNINRLRPSCKPRTPGSKDSGPMTQHTYRVCDGHSTLEARTISILTKSQRWGFLGGVGALSHPMQHSF